MAPNWRDWKEKVNTVLRGTTSNFALAAAIFCKTSRFCLTLMTLAPIAENSTAALPFALAFDELGVLTGFQVDTSDFAASHGAHALPKESVNVNY
jgi:hypothetical protein